MHNAVEIGDRVAYDGYYAEVSFVGEGLSGLPAGRWVGITFDEPVGKNDGSVKGVRYWTVRRRASRLHGAARDQGGVPYIARWLVADTFVPSDFVSSARRITVALFGRTS
jgi:hypothetical protein